MLRVQDPRHFRLARSHCVLGVQLLHSEHVEPPAGLAPASHGPVVCSGCNSCARSTGSYGPGRPQGPGRAAWAPAALTAPRTAYSGSP